MNNKYTFLQLCEQYDKIEIPIIQRDFAQGRKTEEVERIRSKFLNDFLIPSIIQNKKIELDFVYGSVIKEAKDENQLQKIFIPLDGQQRLTVLFLTHFFIGVKEEKLESISSLLLKFTYETRPSAHDFCKLLIEKGSDIINTESIKDEIEDSFWFNDEWKDDPTISGMLTVLDELGKNTELQNSNNLLKSLINKNTQLISFYFTDLEEFGLTENLYIRMNARGKQLTDFENFKSEFFKIIRYDNDLLEDVKDKIEYKWVENLWCYRKDGSYIIDSPFMNYLSFITEMLYFKQAEYRAKSYITNFLDFTLLEKIYSKKINLEFLVFSLDFIEELKDFESPILWGKESLQIALFEALNNKLDTLKHIVLYATLRYSFQQKPKGNLIDYVRVVRNLVENTDDNSRREWPRLLNSIENLISDENVYKVLSTISSEKLLGFRKEQREEEIVKSKVLLKFPLFKDKMFEIEDDKNLKGNITNILKSAFLKNEKEFDKIELSEINFINDKLKDITNIYTSYKEISKNNFKNVWGDLITSSLYKQTYESRLIYNKDYRKHPAILWISKKYSDSNKTLLDFIESRQKNFILETLKDKPDFSLIRDAKTQLYIYYIIHLRISEKNYQSFFKNKYYNFGWLSKETGYKSYYKKGIEACVYFPDNNPIFQVYNQQFRYNLGISKWNTLDIEIIGGNKRNPFELIQKWAKN